MTMWTVWPCTVLVLLTLIVLPCVHSTDNGTVCINSDKHIGEGPQFSHTPNNVTAHQGDTVEFDCSGYYGPLPDGALSTRYVEWFIVSGVKNCNIDCGKLMIHVDEVKAFLEDPEYPRFNLSRYTRQNGAVVGTKLTISNVSREDYDLFLQCRLTSAQMESKEPCATVRIQKYPPNKEIDGGIIFGIIAVILTLVMLVAYCHRGPQIKFWCYFRFGHMCQNYHPEKYTCDVLFIHPDDDNYFVGVMVKELSESLQYLEHNTTAEHLSAEKPLFEGTQELIEQSYCVVFIITPDILYEALYSHLLNVAQKLERKILLVEVHGEGKKVQEWETCKKQFSRSESLGNGLKYMKTHRWPGNTASSRQQKNFWCKIRNDLPIKRTGIRSTAELPLNPV